MPEIAVSSKFAPVLSATCRYILLYGGRGSGKSFFVAQLYVILARQKKYFRGYMMREVLGDIRNSQFQEIKDLLTDMGIIDEFHIRENTMEFEHKVTRNKIISKGFKKSAGNQTAKVKSIKDPTHIWIEEADEIALDDFTKADTSVRTKKAAYVQIILSFNPEDESSWINKKWFINNQPGSFEDALIIKSTYKDNLRNLQESYVNTLEKLLVDNPDYAKIYVLGDWGGGVKGRIFTNWQKIEKLPEGYYFYGLDFGFTNDPTALVRLHHHNNKLHIQELIYETGLTNQDIAKRFAQAGISKTERIYADAAEPKSIEELRRLGYNVIAATKGPGSVNAGIDKIKSFDAVYATSDSKNLWHENKHYSWRLTPEGNPTNEPKDFANHIKDAIRYGVITELGKPKKENFVI
jgi:phage terminase large subunit